MGRNLTTGKYETRTELEDMICAFYSYCHNQTQVARITGVSQTTVAKILRGKYFEWTYREIIKGVEIK